MFQKEWTAKGLSSVRKVDKVVTDEEKKIQEQKRKYLSKYLSNDNELNNGDQGNVQVVKLHEDNVEKKKKKSKHRKEKEKNFSIKDQDISGFGYNVQRKENEEEQPTIANKEEYEYELRKQQQLEEQAHIDGSGWQEAPINQNVKPKIQMDNESDEDLDLVRRPAKTKRTVDSDNSDLDVRRKVPRNNLQQTQKQDSDSDLEVDRNTNRLPRVKIEDNKQEAGLKREGRDQITKQHFQDRGKKHQTNSDDSELNVLRNSAGRRKGTIRDATIKVEDSDLDIRRRSKQKQDSDSDLDIRRERPSKRARYSDKMEPDGHGTKRKGGRSPSKDRNYKQEQLQRDRGYQQRFDSDQDVQRPHKSNGRFENSRDSDVRMHRHGGQRGSKDEGIKVEPLARERGNREDFNSNMELQKSRQNKKRDDRGGEDLEIGLGRGDRRGRQDSDSDMDQQRPDRNKRRKESRGERDGPKSYKQEIKSDPRDVVRDIKQEQEIKEEIRVGPQKQKGYQSDGENEDLKGVAQAKNDREQLGLIDANEFSKLVKEIREKELRDAAQAGGQNEQTVYRQKGRRLTEAEVKEQEEERKQQDTKKKKKTKEDFYEKEGPSWAKGLAQQRMEAEQRQLIQQEAKKPFAREFGNEDMDREGRDKFHWDDPMRDYVMKKKGIDPLLMEDIGQKHSLIDKPQEKGKFIVPQEVPEYSWIRRRVDPPPNRYKIRPGRHWDGVNRSSGFEDKYFQMKSQQVFDRGAQMMDDYGFI